MSGATDADGVEDRRLDDDVGRGVRDLARRATHHAGDRERARRVGDQQRVGRELAGHVVERLEALARGCPSHEDRRAAVGSGVDGRSIEGVDRLAELQHHVVGRVDDVADRALTSRQQAHLDRVGRRANPEPAHPPADEPGAQVGIEDLHRQPLGDRRAAPLLHHRLRPADLLAGCGGDLAREPEDRERVAAVRLDVHVQHDVAVELDEGDAEGRVAGKDEDPVCVAGEAQLVARAEHAVADDAHLLGALDTTVAGQDCARKRDRDALARGDVRRAADDRERLRPVPQRHGREAEAVCARVLLDREQLARDDVLPVGAPTLDGLDLHAQERQAFGELLRRQVDCDELAQP